MNAASGLYVFSNGGTADASFVSAAIFAALAAIVVGAALATLVTVIEAGITTSAQGRRPLVRRLWSDVLGRVSMRVLVPRADTEPR